MKTHQPYKDKIAEMAARTTRVAKMEDNMKKAQDAILRLNTELSSFLKAQENIQSLDQYYQSPDWKEDFEADEAGRFPDDLPRGVLSEDGIYNLLEKNEELWERIKEFAKKAPNKDAPPQEDPTDDRKES